MNNEFCAGADLKPARMKTARVQNRQGGLLVLFDLARPCMRTELSNDNQRL